MNESRETAKCQWKPLFSWNNEAKKTLNFVTIIFLSLRVGSLDNHIWVLSFLQLSKKIFTNFISAYEKALKVWLSSYLNVIFSKRNSKLFKLIPKRVIMCTTIFQRSNRTSVPQISTNLTICDYRILFWSKFVQFGFIICAMFLYLHHIYLKIYSNHLVLVSWLITSLRFELSTLSQLLTSAS